MMDSPWWKNTIGGVKLQDWIYADLPFNLHLYIKNAFEFSDVQIGLDKSSLIRFLFLSNRRGT